MSIANVTDLPRFRMSLDELDSQERFERWEDCMGHLMDVAPTNARNARDFTGEIEVFGVGDIAFSRCRSDAVLLKRSAERISRDHLHHFAFHYFVGGGTGLAISTNGEQQLKPGDLLMIDLDQPIEMPRDDYQAIGLFVPREQILPLLPNAQDFHGRIAPANAPLTRLAVDQLLSLNRILPSMSAADAKQVTPAVLQLVSAAFAPVHADSQVLLASKSNLALIQKITAHIDGRLHDPRLSPEDLGKTFLLSRTRLYKLFESSGGVASHIRTRKLRRALYELTTMRDLPVSSIAYNLGFNSLSDFSRTFKKHYGMAPTDIRNQQSLSPDTPRTISPYAKQLTQSVDSN